MSELTPRRRQGLAIVIPAYNEEYRLPRSLIELTKYQEQYGGPFEVLVCDDGSIDGTAALVRQRAQDTPWLHVIQLPHRGKGSAVRSGMLAANQPYVVLCDADFSMPVQQLDRFVAVLDSGCQLAVGSRELPESHRYKEPARRHVMGRVFNLLVRALVVPGLNDTQCGFKGFHLDAARDIFANQRLDGFSFDAEVLFIARKRGYAMQEVPIDWYFDADSRVRPVADTFSMALDLLRIRLNDIRGRYNARQQPRN